MVRPDVLFLFGQSEGSQEAESEDPTHGWRVSK